MKQEENRKLAEWLGFLEPTKDETEECLRDQRYQVRRWTLHRHSGKPIEHFSSYYWTSPDFYTDEAANALLLEKMPNPMVYRSTTGEWRCRSDHPSGKWELLAKAPDRKTAICLAALKRIEGGGR